MSTTFEDTGDLVLALQELSTSTAVALNMITPADAAQLQLDPVEWLEQQDRCLYGSFAPGTLMDENRRKSVVELVVRVGRPRKTTINADGTVTSTTQFVSYKDAECPPHAFVAVRQDEGSHCVFRIPPENVSTLESLLGHALEHVDGDDAMIAAYVAPTESAQHRPDKWWSSKYLNVKRGGSKAPPKASSSYLHYRECIDDILIIAMRQQIEQLELLRSSRFHDIDASARRVDAARASESGDCTISTSSTRSSETVRVAELCCGDGSFAAKLLAEFPTKFKAHMMFERNTQLAGEAAKKTETQVYTPAAASSAFHNDNGAGVRVAEEGAGSGMCENDTQRSQPSRMVINVDCCSEEGQCALSQIHPQVDVWIASGSILHGQVGTFGMAEPTLRAMAASLRPGGCIIISGFTQSFIHPGLVHSIGLEMAQGSIASTGFENLESGFNRFHLFVLRKPASGQIDPDENARDGSDGVPAAVTMATSPLLRVMIHGINSDSDTYCSTGSPCHDVDSDMATAAGKAASRNQANSSANTPAMGSTASCIDNEPSALVMSQSASH